MTKEGADKNLKLVKAPESYLEILNKKEQKNE